MNLSDLHLTVYAFINTFSIVIFFPTVICFIENIVATFKKDCDLKEKSFIILYSTHLAGMFESIPLKIKRFIHAFLLLFMAIACLLSIKPFVINTLGCNDINVMPEGTYCYYVEATNKSGKTYTTPARIYVDDYEFQIDEIFFTNGGSVSFRSCSIDRKDGEYYTETVERGNNKEWKIKLLNKKAYNSQVEETVAKMGVFDYMCVLLAISSFYMAIAHLIEIGRMEGVN
jgi:hypothetical protein